MFTFFDLFLNGMNPRLLCLCPITKQIYKISIYKYSTILSNWIGQCAYLPAKPKYVSCPVRSRKTLLTGSNLTMRHANKKNCFITKALFRFLKKWFLVITLFSFLQNFFEFFFFFCKMILLITVVCSKVLTICIGKSPVVFSNFTKCCLQFMHSPLDVC